MNADGTRLVRGSLSRSAFWKGLNADFVMERWKPLLVSKVMGFIVYASAPIFRLCSNSCDIMFLAQGHGQRTASEVFVVQKVRINSLFLYSWFENNIKCASKM